ncbi:TonB-dependent receptor [Methylovulum psychrotolerans]|uniref:Energy transducer TonB n=1 Tax=Methylovulum psychrotolerans TaxID=1704499 RepID=A0A2S5CPX8_9GAMM|nr:TonB-dependent receptor [Methylovulum psychrotolerans]MBT9098533.1 TonB-dependent receptor [Methylovulum psychrotolerans]POZ52869.1 energy transducer TonB [Methylovulum psychrotolerans]
MKKVFWAVSLLAVAAGGRAEEAAVDLEAVEVVGVSPMQSVGGVSVDKIPAAVQTVSSAQLQQAQSLSLAEYLNRYLGSVHINEAQNNPLQPDIYYRGFVASPLLGLPQGLSVYVNGVRFNEPFGDSVNWDLIPPGALESTTLHGGSNPVYGLNTLGGAVVMKTKTGFSAPGHQLEVYGGSFDRHVEEITSGGNNGKLGYFLDLRSFEEQGWRDFSPSAAKQALGTLSWHGDRGGLDLTVAANDNDLRGNGTAPVQLLAQDRNAVFTHPDQTVTRLFFTELAGNYALNDTVELTGNVYFRQNRMRSFNGDSSDYSACADNAALLCTGEGDPVLDTQGNTVNFSESVDGATNNVSYTNMYTRGGTAQALFTHDVWAHENSLAVGASYDNADVHFGSDTELAELTADRGTIGSGIYVDESRVRLHTHSDTVGFYATDSLSITDKLTATVAGRYNHIDLAMADGYINADRNLNGQHIFQRFNPSAGLTYQALPNVAVYGSYSESSRAPTPMELSCADPAAPCKLPNSFVSDPELKQVVANTFEGGFKGHLKGLLGKGDGQWNLGYFHTANENDIIFRRDFSSNFNNQGYFSNVGKTLRQGLEMGSNITYPQLFGRIDDWHFSANYTYLNAIFLDGFGIQNPLNPEQIIAVQSGDRIPGIPEHLLKLAVGVDLWRKWSIGVNGLYSGSQYYRGDEANVTRPLAGYWLFNATTEYKVSPHVTVFAKLDNIADERYSSFGMYGNAADVLGSKFNDGRFMSPGAPRAGWVGLRLTF